MRVLVRESIAEAGVDLLRERFDVDVDEDSPLEEIIGRYDAIVVRSATKLTADVIAKAERLKGRIFRIGHIGWYDVFDITTALAAVELGLDALGAEVERGVAVTRALEAYSQSLRV